MILSGKRGRPLVDVAIMTQHNILFSDAMACRVFLVFKGPQGRLCGMFPYLSEPCGGFLLGDEPSLPRPDTKPFRYTRKQGQHSVAMAKTGFKLVHFRCGEPGAIWR